MKIYEIHGRKMLSTFWWMGRWGFITTCWSTKWYVTADERYKDCKSKFYLRTKYDDDDDETLKEVDRGFLKVTKKVSRNRKKIWASAELHKS